MAEDSRPAGPRRPGALGGRRRAPLLFGVLLLALGGTAFVRESLQALVGHGREQSPQAYPSLWLLGGPQVEPLRELAERIDRRVPRDASIVVDTGYPEPERHYLEMWIAWLLPRHRVLPAGVAPPAGRPAYRLEVPPRAPSGDGNEDEMLRTDAGVLLRLGLP